MPDLIEGHYYEISRNNKIEVVKFKKVTHSTAHFNFMDGDEEEFILTYDIIEDGIYKIKHMKELSVLMA